MFQPKPRDSLDALIDEYNLPGVFRSLIDKFLDLKQDQREAVIGYVQSVAADLMADTAAPVDQRAVWEAEADEFAAMAREQFLSEKRRESQASSAKESGNPGGVA